MNPDSVYEFTLPVFIKMLGGLKGVLKKAGEHGLDEATLLNDRLAPDMFPLVKQVQVATDNAKGVAARLSGSEVPSYPDTETTLAELDARIDKTIAYLQSITKESFANAEQVQVTFPYFPGKFMAGFEYAREYAIPNFFFHVATAYAIIRKNGVAIGKADYMNGLPLQDL
ncbi:DUF1993 domain-containing protein [Patescibacteria group bacterium]|nr:DUF1993 domain-containing protein [Patescibacteria group bacterium]